MRTLLLTIFAFSCCLVSAQRSATFSKANTSQKFKESQSFHLKTKTIDLAFENFKITNVNNMEFSVESQDQDSLIYNIIFTNKNTHGYIYYANKDVGFVVNTDKNGELVFTETSKENIVVTCEFDKKHQTHSHVTKGPNSDPKFVGNYATETDVYKLQSRPGAKHCIYLDFDGENMSQFSWSYSGNAVSVPDEVVKAIWESVAADYIPFDVDVTNNRAVFDSYKQSDRVMCLFMDFGQPGWAGVAYLNSFGGKNPCLVDMPTNPSMNTSYLFRTPSHELGHTMGLKHDGLIPGGVAYYKGHGEFVPIMGTGSRIFSLWSKGDYTNANEKQDDLALITGKLDKAGDDYSGVRFINIEQNGDVLESLNHGTVDWNDDLDEWQFSLKADGNVNLTFDPVLKYTDLDVELSIIDSKGNVIANLNPVGQRKVTFNQFLTKGTYSAIIQSGAELGASDGWNKYGVFGYYEIYGSIESPAFQEYDLRMPSLNALDLFCESSDNVSLSIPVQNTGEKDFNSIDFEVKVDGNLLTTITKNGLLTAGSTNNYTLDFVLPEGPHHVTLIAKDPQNREVNTFDNTSSFQSDFHVGKTFEFITNYSLYNTTDISWSIENTSTGEKVENQNLSVENVGQNISQKMCLDKGACFDFEMTGDLKICDNYNYPKWSKSHGAYTSGDRVIHKNGVYQAKWWTLQEPPNTEWTKIEDCMEAQSIFEVFQEGSQTASISVASQNYSSGFTSSFCTSVTSSKGIGNNSSLVIFPNPSQGIVNITNADGFTSFKVLDLSGKVVTQQAVQNTNFHVDLSKFNKGVYFFQFVGNGTVTTKEIIKMK